MKEIEFQGKRRDNGEWVKGFYYEHGKPLQCISNPNEIKIDKGCIVRTGFADWNMPRQVEFIEVIPETVGQFIGLLDMSGDRPQKIYEHDVVEITLYSHSESAKIICQHRRKIEFKDGMFGVQWTRTDFLSLKHHFADSCSIIRIGNIWDDNLEFTSDDIEFISEAQS